MLQQLLQNMEHFAQPVTSPTSNHFYLQDW